MTLPCRKPALVYTKLPDVRRKEKPSDSSAGTKEQSFGLSRCHKVENLSFFTVLHTESKGYVNNKRGVDGIDTGGTVSSCNIG